MLLLKQCAMKNCMLNMLVYVTYYIIYLFSLFLTPLFRGSGYPDAKYYCKKKKKKLNKNKNSQTLRGLFSCYVKEVCD